MSAAWVVVADTSRARIFSAEKPASSLVEIQTLAHPEARLHEGDLVSDTAGRDRSSGMRAHNVGHTNDAKQEEASRFASHVCETIECGRVNRHFKKLYVIAAPSFLGMLRKQQTSSVQRVIAGEVSKNLSSHNLNDIRKSLPEYL
ncbi:host attachment protein [Solemya velesiana gill symbiont]|uniref:Host attachment protein n=1 Tax=Solemya velesiana gill symbiont TaxID=1918948 RepID=A0A1T2KV58_9GAMM|nr:host attachment protein [Solemya velesiana gill symbiont]OOZ36681.1 Host attachment protein [Solemya velesiana gill symbiont]